LLEMDNKLSNGIDKKLKDMEEARVKREGKLFAEFMKAKKEEQDGIITVGSEIRLYIDSAIDNVLGVIADVVSGQDKNSTNLVNIVSEAKKMMADGMINNREVLIGELNKSMEKFIKDKNKNYGLLKGGMEELSAKIGEVATNITLSDGEKKLQVDSLKEGFLIQVAKMREEQAESVGSIEILLKDAKESMLAPVTETRNALIDLLKKRLKGIEGSIEKGDKKSSKEIKELEGQLSEIIDSRILSDTEVKLHMDSATENTMKLISKIADKQKGQSEAIKALRDLIGANNVDIDALIQRLGDVINERLSKMDEDQGERITKLLEDSAGERKLLEERNEKVITHLESTIAEARREIALLQKDQEESKAEHGEEIARLEGTISDMESRQGMLASGRSVANKDKVISQFIPIIQDAVQMVLNRESIAVKRAAGKFATNKDKLVEWLEDFYRNLPEFMHMKLDKILSSFIAAIQVEVLIERGVPDGDPVDLAKLIHNYIMEYVKKHVEFSISRLKKVVGNEDPLAVEIVLDEWYTSRAMQVAIDEANEVCGRVEKFVTEEEDDRG